MTNRFQTASTHWVPAARMPDWPQSEVHLWRIDLRNAPTDASILTADERARPASFQQTRSLLRSLLGRYLNQSPQSLHLDYGANGKPFLSPHPSRATLHFNLSHADEIALIAITAADEVGVDVERIRSVGHIQKIARRFFTAEDLTWLGEEPSEERFFQVWTRTEARLKAQGMGVFIASSEVTPVSVINIDAGGGYAAAVAVLEEMPTLRFWEWEAE